MRHQLSGIAAAVALTLSVSSAMAAITADEAAKLGGPELTPVGAERAGNADGTIPEWTGGLGPDAVPSGWQRGQSRPDFYADDKILFTIDATNVNEHKDKLSEGQVALITQYPDAFKMHIYPSRRSAAWPQFVYDNIKQYATQAELREGGNGVKNVWAAIPFPIPKNGNEVIWNHNTRFLGTMRDTAQAVENVIYNDGKDLLWTFSNQVHHTYYDPEAPEKDVEAGVIFKYNSTGLTPSRDTGSGILALENINAEKFPRKAWTYDPGERRVRRAPNLAFDTPDRPINVIDDYDLFSGSPERYEWNLIGKKEMYVPYNNNRLNRHDLPYEEVYTKKTINADLIRWELHRVWVVEATVRPDARHVYAKRVFYIDEDTWTALATDKYDGNGNLWRIGIQFPVTAPEVPVTSYGFYAHWDLKVGAYYSVFGVQGQKAAHILDAKPPKASFFTPAAVRRRGK